MLFTLKILRYIIGLVVKIVLFPIKLVGRLVGNQVSGTETLEPSDGIDTESNTEADSMAIAEAAGAGNNTESESPNVATDGARTNIKRFRVGLIALGVLQLLFVGIGLLWASQALLGNPTILGGSAIVLGGTLLVGVTLSAVSVLAGAALSRFPTGGWYVGMGYVGLTLALSVFALPVGVVTMAIYLPVGYLGYTGRDALAGVYGSEPSATNTGGHEDVTVSPDEGVAMADATATPTSSDRDDATSPPTASESETANPAGETATRSGPVAASANEGRDTETAAPTSAGETDTTGDTEGSDPAVSDDTEDEPTPETNPIPNLQAELTASEPATRRSAVEELAEHAQTGEMPEQAVMDALSDRLDDGNPNVRVVACEAIGSLGVRQAKPALKQLRIDSDPEVSRAASRAIRNLE
jgi:hypothetical protein